jgi:hypothetical protein
VKGRVSFIGDHLVKIGDLWEEIGRRKKTKKNKKTKKQKKRIRTKQMT